MEVHGPLVGDAGLAVVPLAQVVGEPGPRGRLRSAGAQPGDGVLEVAPGDAAAGDDPVDETGRTGVLRTLLLAAADATGGLSEAPVAIGGLGLALVVDGEEESDLLVDLLLLHARAVPDGPEVRFLADPGAPEVGEATVVAVVYEAGEPGGQGGAALTGLTGFGAGLGLGLGSGGHALSPRISAGALGEASSSSNRFSAAACALAPCLLRGSESRRAVRNPGRRRPPWPRSRAGTPGRARRWWSRPSAGRTVPASPPSACRARRSARSGRSCRPAWGSGRRRSRPRTPPCSGRRPRTRRSPNRGRRRGRAAPPGRGRRGTSRRPR